MQYCCFCHYGFKFLYILTDIVFPEIIQLLPSFDSFNDVLFGVHTDHFENKKQQYHHWILHLFYWCYVPAYHLCLVVGANKLHHASHSTAE